MSSPPNKLLKECGKLKRREIHTVKRHDCVSVRFFKDVDGRFFENLN
jgi:hypothetical protein